MTPAFEDANWNLIPAHMREGVERWIVNGIEPGSFLAAFLCNDLKETFARADDINAATIRNYVQFFYSFAPSGCWGSREKYTAWAKSGGLAGMAREHEAEAAWERHQQSLTESGGADDSAYRRDLINAGRGHLLR